MSLTAIQIAQLIKGSLEGNPDVIVTRPAKIEEGGEGTITFLANPKYEAHAYNTTASVLLVSNDFQPTQKIAATLIRVPDVYGAIAVLLQQFSTQNYPKKGIDPQAIIHPQAQVGENVAIGAFVVVEAGAVIKDGAILFPQVYIGKNAQIGAETILFSGVKIYHECRVGKECILHANVVVGSDGFGFAPQADGSFQKIPQIGNVIIKDKVEIGANSTIDRATLTGTSTIIHKGVKLDNLIQVAHNVEVGENTVIAAQTGIAGSTKIGKNCMIGGQVGFAGHIQIADRTQIQGQSGISKTIKKPNTALYGTPALDYSNYLRSYAVFKKLPDLYQKINQLEKELKELKSKT